MQVACEVKQCEKDKNKGKGIFVTADVAQGTVIWAYNPKHHLEFKSREQLDKHLQSMKSKQDQVELIEHCFVLSSDTVAFCKIKSDIACYMNHSEQPNVANKSKADATVMCALRDLKKGEEIVEDYREYHFVPWFEALWTDPKYKDLLWQGI